jgi:hypothetical protein
VNLYTKKPIRPNQLYQTTHKQLVWPKRWHWFNNLHPSTLATPHTHHTITTNPISIKTIHNKHKIKYKSRRREREVRGSLSYEPKWVSRSTLAALVLTDLPRVKAPLLAVTTASPIAIHLAWALLSERALWRSERRTKREREREREK